MTILENESDLRDYVKNYETDFWKMNEGCGIMDPVSLGVTQAHAQLSAFDFYAMIFLGRRFIFSTFFIS